VHFGERQKQTGELLAAGNDAEFRRLFDRVGGVEPGIGQAMIFASSSAPAAGTRRNPTSSRECGPNPAPGRPCLHQIAGILFKRVAERVVGGHEKPGVTAGFDQRAAGTDRKRMGIVGPVETIGRASVTGDA